MSLTVDVYVFSLLPALFWGVSPTFTKRGILNGGTSLQASVVVVAVSVVCYAVGFAIVGDITHLNSLSPIAWVVFAGSGVAGAFAWLASFTGVDKVGASVNSAVFNVHPLFATVVALAFLGERLSRQTVFGIIVLVGGLGLVAGSNGGNRDGWELRHLIFPLAASAAYAISNVIRRFGLTMTPATTLEAISINAVATLVVLLMYAVFTRDVGVLPESRTALRAFVISGLLSAVALFFLFEAFARGPVAVVSALSGLSPVIATLVAAAALADVERVTRGVVGGACLVVIGATLISLA